MAAIPTVAQVSVTTYQYNNQRTGVNSNETVLTPSNVNSANFGRLFSQPVDGQVYAQPLYMPNVTINGAVHNVVFVATEHDSVYAFDADSNSGSNAQPLWRTSLLPPGATTVSDNYCTDISPEYGITGTPVIDSTTNTLYAVAETLENSTYVKKLHALDTTTGAEKPGSPIAISASVAVRGQSPVTFDPLRENQRVGLLLDNGVVYAAFGAHCGDWRGWILGYSYNESNFTQTLVFFTEPSSVNGVGKGIWMSGQGLSRDAGSNLFAATGNGHVKSNITPPLNNGDSVIRMDLSRGAVAQDYFTPGSQDTLDSQNQDLGSGGIAILPDQTGPHPHLLVTADKYQTIYVLDRDNLGRFNSSSGDIVQELNAVIGSMFSTPVYFNGKVYFWSADDVLKAFTLINGMLSTSATDSGPDLFSFPGAVPTISANGASNGILWVLRCDGDSACTTSGLYAYDPSSLSTGSLYNSNQNPGRDNPGGGIKFAVPIVANGKVYVGAAGQLSVYGELSGGGQTAAAITSANNTTFTVGTAGSFMVTTTGTPPPTLTETGAQPSGVTFVDNGNGTATLNGTPATGTSGTYTFTITASNGVGSPANQSFTLKVNQVPATFTAGTTGNSAVGSASYTISTCAQNLAIGKFTLCGESYNDVSTGANVKVNYSPSPGNGIIAWATWCFNSSCNSSISGVTATIGDNINGTESCFAASPHSPFITDANGGAQGSGDFQQHYVWYCPSISSGVTSFTVTPSNPNLSYVQLNISEWKAGSLAASCSPISACFEDVDNFGQAGISTGGTTATITTNGSTVNANDLVFAVTEVPCCSFTASPGTGYTGITVAPSVTPGMVSEAEAVTVTGIQTATTTWTGGSTHWFGVIVPLKSAGAAPLVATPTFSPGTGTYSSAQTVAISSTTSGATICYATNGTTPAASTPGTCSTGATLANGGTVTVGVSETLQAIGTESGLTNSAVGSAAYVITVATPSITSLNPTSGPVGTGVTITGTNFGSSQGTSTVTFNGTAGTSTSWSATGIAVPVPIGATTGNVLVTVRGVASNGVSYTVTTPPTITSANNTTFTIGTAGSFTVTTTGTPTPTLTETGTLPSDIKFKDNGNGTATLSGTPASGSGGTYSLTLTADNGVGTPASQSFTLKVNQAPAITSSNNTTFTVGKARSFTVTTRGTPEPSLTETGTLPSGVTFVDNGNGTATLSGTPASGSSGSYPLTITASNGVGTPARQGFTLKVNHRSH